MADKKRDQSLDMVGPVFELSQPPTKKAKEYLTAHKSWTYSAISLIARDVAQVKLHLYKKKVKGKEIELEEIHEHEALSVLYYANEFMTLGQLIEITQTYLDLAGEAPWALIRAGGKPYQIWPLRPDWIEVIPSKKEFIDHYVYHPGGGYGKVKIPAEDLIFFKYFNPVNTYRGKGSVQAASMAIDIDDFSSEYNRTFFYNAAIPSIFFTTDQRIGEAEGKRLMRAWRSKFEGRKNAHKVAFLGKGLTPHEIGGKHRELDFIDSKKYIRDEILASFHTSKANLGVVEDVNRANQEASDARFQSKVVRPRVISLCYYLNEFYLRNWGDENLFFDFDDPTPEDTELKLKVYESGLKNGWLTINEVREMENRPPAEGGDTIYLPFTLQPVGSVAEKITGFFGKKKEKLEGMISLKVKKKKKQDKIKDGLNMPIPPKRLKELKIEKAQKKIQHDLVKMIVNLMKLNDEQVGKLKTVKEVKSQFGPDGREAFWKAMVAKTDAQEMRMRGLLYNLWKQQESGVKDRLEQKQKKSFKVKINKGDIDDILFDLKKEIKSWKSTLALFIRDIVAEKGRETFQLLGMAREIDLSTRRARTFIETKGLKFIKSANKTQRERLARVLSEGIEKGESVPELSKKIDRVYQSVVTNKSEQIARTEVLRATNFATEEAYRQSEVVIGKEWLTALDERTCPFCDQMNGKIVEVSQDYFKRGEKLTIDGQTLNFDYEKVAHPPLHPGCRCTLIPVIK